MRFGWLAAFAAMVCASQAQAVTWLKYEVRGSGVEVNTSSFPDVRQSSSRVDFYLNFSVEIDPVGATADPIAGAYSSDGRVFSTINVSQDVPGGFTVDGRQLSTLLLRTGTVGGGAPTVDLQANLTYADGDAVVALPTALASSAASGTISYFSMSKSFTRRLTGTITGFAILGQTSGYEGLNLTTVPEPASWAMMILGVGAIGASARRRNRRSVLA